MFKDYAKKYENSELDRFKKTDDAVYTHSLNSIWNDLKYENVMRKLTPEEFEEFTTRAEYIEEYDEMERERWIIIQYRESIFLGKMKPEQLY